MKKIALITASLVVLASPVLAENAKTVGNAPAEAKYSTVSKDEMFSSKLKGLNVYNQKDESIGEITDLALKNRELDALILSCLSKEPSDRPPTAEWGIMVAEGAAFIVSGEWWIALFPGAALMVAVFCFNLLGDGLRDIVDPRRRT